MAGGGLADRPEEEDNNSNIPSFDILNKVELPLEKQLTHAMFCQQVSTISLEDARTLLGQLHYLYLSQQVFLVKWAKQDFLYIFNNKS